MSLQHEIGQVSTGIVGRLVDIDEHSELRDRKNHFVGWDSSGKIILVAPYQDLREYIDLEHVLFLPQHSLLVPGAIDCHLHYPQTRIIGGFGLDLLDWLNSYVWPEEKRFEDSVYAQEVAKQFFRQLVSSGTTSAMIFGSQFESAMDVFFSLATQIGLCVFSGLVAQDRESLPALEKSVQDYESASHSLIKRWHKRGRIHYTILPRFSIACSPPILELCGSLLKSAPDLSMQTHINESIHEIAKVAEMFPKHRDYLDTYESFGLLGRRSSFAHSIHTTTDELQRLKEYDCRVVHCPSSNSFLGSGAFQYLLHKEFDISVGVGTDVGAGLSFSMWKEMGHAHLIQMRLSSDKRFIWSGRHILKAMTVDGATFLGTNDQVGRIQTGQWADLVLLSPRAESYLSLEKDSNSSLTLEQYLFRLATAHEDGFVSKTWIQGQIVFSRDEDYYISCIR